MTFLIEILFDIFFQILELRSFRQEVDKTTFIDRYDSTLGSRSIVGETFKWFEELRKDFCISHCILVLRAIVVALKANASYAEP